MAEFEGTPRFRVIRRLGAGGMGIVYEAVDGTTGRHVALKTLRDVDGQALYRLKNEFRALQGIEHPNLVQLGELIEHHGEWFFTMELVDGRDFLAYVRRHDEGRDAFAPTFDGAAGSGPAVTGRVAAADPAMPAIYDEQRLRHALAQVVTGLAALHAAGKVHRDIKPSNIRVADDGRVVILDFGLVTDRADHRQSIDNGVIGTIAYMAPEQAAAKPVGPEADWYALGSLLYEALTGRVPFSGAMLEVLMDKQRHEPPPPRALAPHVPRDLDDLCVELLRFSPPARPTIHEIRKRLGLAAPSVTGLGSTPSSYLEDVLIGREDGLGALAAALADSRAAGPVTMAVCGASGIGKSALVQAFVRRAAGEPNALVLAGRCYERESVPYKALDGVVDALSRHLRRLPDDEVRELLPPDAALLTQVFPVLARVKALARAPLVQGGALDPLQLRDRSFAAVRALFERLARERPLVLVIDDLHWTDADSLHLLRALLGGAPLPLLLLVSVRDEAAADPTASLPGDVRRMRLGPLSLADATELARRLLERLGVADDALARRIAEEAGGHPMYVDALAQRASTDAAATSWDAPRLDDAIRARLHRLPEPAIRALELVATAGVQIQLELLREASGLDPLDLDRALAQLRAATLVRRGGTGDREVVEPYHDRVREAVLSGIAAEARAEHHRRIAAALEKLGQDRQQPEVMARHLAAAGERERAAAYARDAARHAARGVAFDRAATLYRLALDLGHFPAEERRDLLVELAEALINAGRSAESVAMFLDAARGADPTRRTLCLMRAATMALYTGEVTRSLEIIAELFADLGLKVPATPGAALASLVRHRAVLTVGGLRYRRRHASEVAPSELARADGLRNLAIALGMVDNIRGADFQARALRHALRIGEPQRVAHALLLESSFFASQSASGLAHGRRRLELARELAASAADPMLGLMVRQHEGLMTYFAGDFRGATAILAEVHGRLAERYVDNDVVQALAYTRLFQCLSLRELGAIGELLQRVEEYTRIARQRGELYLDTTLRRLCTIAWLARDRLDDAERNLEETRWPPAEQGFHLQHAALIEAHGEIALYRGEAARAIEALAEQRLRSKKALWLRVRSFRIRHHWLGGRLALGAVATGHDPRHHLGVARRAAQLLRRERMAHADVFAGLLEAGVAARAQAPERAADLLARVVGDADRCGMVMAAAVARRLRGQLLGGDAGRSDVEAADAALGTQGVTTPERLAAVIGPGFTA
jgi:hypothetical protein